MTQLKVAGASLNQIPLDWKGNRHRICDAIALAQNSGVQILCLPELCISGYGCEDAFQSSGLLQAAFQSMLAVISHTQGIAVAVGLPVLVNDSLYNAVAWICDGKLCGLVPKQFLAGDGIHYEPRWFQAWERGTVESMSYEHNQQEITVPFGDLIFDHSGIRIAFEICEDSWVQERPASRWSGKSVDIILNPSASHFAFKQFELRKQVVQEGARMASCVYVYSNLLGCEAGRIIYDGTVLIASGSQGILAEGKRFSYQEMLLTCQVVDLDTNRLQRRKNTKRIVSSESESSLCVCTALWNYLEEFSYKIKTDSFSQSFPPLLSAFEEFTYAVSLGLWDYLRKSNSRGFVVSASGGVDSSAVIVLVYVMAHLALKELGATRFLQILPFLKNSEPSKQRSIESFSVSKIMSQLLLTLYQSSKFSSQSTLSAAQTLCEAVGSRFVRFDIAPLIQNYTEWAEETLERPLSWENDDLALQNIQARVRGPGAWFLANIRGALLLATSNRSEVAVGYATMDGDTCGGLSPLAGIDKAFLLQWICWIEHEGFEGLPPLHFLSAVTAQVPTAELRPPELHQSDEKDLMPYSILNLIEKCAIHDKKTPLEVWRCLKSHGSEDEDSATSSLSPEQLARYIERFFSLWSRNQWKRERYAPSFHVDDRNLDPKTWCRFPILSSGFEQELEQLREVVKNLKPVTSS